MDYLVEKILSSCDFGSLGNINPLFLTNDGPFMKYHPNFNCPLDKKLKFGTYYLISFVFMHHSDSDMSFVVTFTPTFLYFVHTVLSSFLF